MKWKEIKKEKKMRKIKNELKRNNDINVFF